MQEKLRTIRLYGKLGARFGRVHQCVANTTQDAMRYLCAMVPGFERELKNENGVAYACFIGKQNINENQLDYPAGNDDIRIAPVLMGSKRGGIFQVILGVAFIAVGVFTGISPLVNIGISMAIGGVVQMLSPSAKGLGTKDAVNNGASYNFGAPVNTSAQGNPVPLTLGEVIQGGAMLSVSVFAEDSQ